MERNMQFAHAKNWRVCVRGYTAYLVVHGVNPLRPQGIDRLVDQICPSTV